MGVGVPVGSKIKPTEFEGEHPSTYDPVAYDSVKARLSGSEEDAEEKKRSQCSIPGLVIS